MDWTKWSCAFFVSYQEFYRWWFSVFIPSSLWIIFFSKHYSKEVLFFEIFLDRAPTSICHSEVCLSISPLFFEISKGVKGQKLPKMAEDSVCLIPYLRNHTSCDCDFWQNDDISSKFFHSSKILSFLGFLGQKMT